MPDLGRHAVLHTFKAVWSPDIADTVTSSRYEFRIEPMGEALSRVTIEHSGIPVGTPTEEQVSGGFLADPQLAQDAVGDREAASAGLTARADPSQMVALEQR